MKEKIVEIIGAEMDPLIAEVKAQQIIIMFNQRVIEAFKTPHENTGELLIRLFIDI